MSIASEISRLQTAKANLKTSIEGKGVTVPSATTLDGYPALVDAISGSGIDPNIVCRAAQMFYYGNDSSIPKPTMPEKVTLNLPICRDISQMFAQYIASAAYSLGIKEAEITLQFPVNAVNFARRNYPLEKITFPNGITLTSTYYDFCRDAQKLKSIIGAIDFASTALATNSSDAFKCTVLEDIEFVPNHIPFNAAFTSSALKDTSIVSICNGLSETATGQTLTMTSDVKTRMSAMMGTVSVPSGESYHIFTPDVSGTVSISDFVTNTKGWTLA
jgi:hypothetical protein